MRQCRNSVAFTLIEVLVALSVIFLVLGTAYGAYAAATQSVSRCRTRMAVEQDARTLMGMLQRELRCIYVRLPEEMPPAKSADLKTLTREQLPAVAGTNADPDNLLSFVTMSGISDPDHPTSGLYNIAYRLDTSRKLLLRRQMDMLNSSSADEDDTNWLCVARQVESVKVAFFDKGSWHEAWEGKPDRGIPQEVRIEMTLIDTGGHPHLFSTAVAVPLGLGARNEVAVQVKPRK